MSTRVLGMRMQSTLVAVTVTIVMGCVPFALSGHGDAAAQASQRPAGTQGSRQDDSRAIPELVRAKGCLACHHMTEVEIGPPFSAIALRHAGRKDVMGEVLAQKIVHGGAGNWGAVPMVANKHVTVEEAREMARWILEIRAGP